MSGFTRAERKRLKTARIQKGNIYVLYVALIAMVVAAFYVAACFSLSAILEFRVKSALEAASLACANDLSQIVINDPHWGYIALTDHPPVGSRTVAGDQEPLPVTGINTIIGTVRQEWILANAIGTTEALQCAQIDIAAARHAQRRLEEQLRDSLSSEYVNTEDFNGKMIEPLARAREIYESNTGDLAKICGFKTESITAQLGYLDGGSSTNCRLPGSVQFSGLDKETAALARDGKYPAFVDLPYKGESFYFCGLGEQSSLVSGKYFRHGNGEQMCSIVRLTAKLKKLSDKTAKKTVEIESRACAQPFYTEDRTKPPLMALSIPQGLPSNLRTLRDLFTSRALTTQIIQHTAVGGDYPSDPKARLAKHATRPATTVRQVFTQGTFDWLRAAHCNISLESLIGRLDLPLVDNKATGQNRSNSMVHLYGFNGDGNLVVIRPKKTPFRNQITQESQLYSLAFNAIKANQVSWTFKARNQVHRLGTINGGKHAGQAMASIEYVEELRSLSSREQALNLDNRFGTKAGSRYDQSRLAVEFEISSPQQISFGSPAI